MVEFLAELTLGLLVAEEERVVLLPLLDLVINPVLEAIIVNILDAPRALAQADEGVFAVVGVVEADPALVVVAEVTFVGDALHLQQVLLVDAARFEVLLGELLLLLDYLLQLEPGLPDFDQIPHIQGIHLPRRKHSPQHLFVGRGALEPQGVLADLDGVEGRQMIGLRLVEQVLSIMHDEGIIRYHFAGDDAIVRRVEVEQLLRLRLSRLDGYVQFSTSR